MFQANSGMYRIHDSYLEACQERLQKQDSKFSEWESFDCTFQFPPSAPSQNILTGFLLRVAECIQNSDDMYQTTPNDTCLDEVCFNCYHRCVSLIFGLKSGIPFFVKQGGKTC